MVGMLVEDVEPLEDPRHGNADRRSLHDILVIALCTILYGGETCTDIALFGRSKREFPQFFLPLRNGIPSHDTFSRVFSLLDPEVFQKWSLGFMGQFAQGCEGVLAIDGKTLRRSYDRAEGQSHLQLVSAWAAEYRLVLGQLAVDGKSNGITAVPKLLELLALKGNQESLNEDARLFLDDPDTPVAQTTKGHGRIEIRRASESDDMDWLQERHQWPGLAAVRKITASRQVGNRTSVESRYYLLS